MSHADMQDALGAYADGELEAARRAALEAHLATCAECRAELDALRELTSAIHSQPVPDPGPQYWSRFADRVAARTEPQAAPGGVSLYDRLTSWLFPHERFAWVRAATALAACTLLVTLGLRGFRPVAPVTQGPSEVGPPPVAETQDKPAVPSSRERTESPPARQESRSMSREEGRDLAATQRATESLPSPSASREIGPAPVPQPAPVVTGPVPDAVAESFAKAAPEPQATDSRQAVPERGPFAAAPPPRPAPPAASKDETGTALPSEPPPASMRALVPRQITVEPPAAKGVLESLVTPVRPLEPGSMPRVGSPMARVRTTFSTPPVDSLLARDARLWPRRDDPAERPRIAALATELSARADDPRLRPRAVAYLEHLVATSSDEVERERWRRMLGSIGDR